MARDGLGVKSVTGLQENRQDKLVKGQLDTMNIDTCSKNGQHLRLASKITLYDRFMSVAPPLLVLAMVTGYIAYVCYRQYWMLYSLQFPDFDMSFYHQEIWLLSKFKEPFTTIGRSMNAFGNHANFINFIFVPIYWVKSSPLVLLWSETIAIGLAGIFVYLIAKLRLQSRFMGAFITAVFFMYPALHYLNFENYHPVSFAVLFFLMYWYGYQTKKSWLHIISAILLCSVKENMALVLVGTALYQYIIARWKPAKWYILAGVIYTAFLLYVFMPYINANHVGLQSSKYAASFHELLTRVDTNLKYLRDLLYPLGLLPLFNPLLLLFNSQFWLNLSTSWGYAHSIKYHYTAGMIGAIFVSLIYGTAFIVRIGERIQIKRQITMAFIIYVLATSIVINNKIDHRHFVFHNMLKPGPHPDMQLMAEVNELKSNIAGKSVSVKYNLLPFFSDRDVSYMWPKPLRSQYPHKKDIQPEYVILFKRSLRPEEKDLLAENSYIETLRTRKLVVFKANDTPDIEFLEKDIMDAENDETRGDDVLSEELARSIATGVSNRVIYVDTRIGVKPSGLELLRHSKNNVHTYTKGFMDNRNLLFNSGLLVMQYAIGRPEPTETEYEVLRQFIANGGRILLLCPAWVWTSYDKKTIDQLPYARIAKNFGLQLEARYVKPPMKIVHPDFKVSRPEEVLYGTFSPIDYQRNGFSFPIVEDKNGNASVVAATRGSARIIVWGQNNLLSKKNANKKGAQEFVAKALDWLLAESSEDIQAD